MKDLHTFLLDLFNNVHQICEENNLRYYMVGGTMLGAIRHKGFIPWDDDIDIAMPREDYEKFIRLSEKDIPNHIRIRHKVREKNYLFQFAKVDNVNTTLIEAGRKEYGKYGGIYLDIFPLDNISDRKIFRKITSEIIFKLKRLINIHYEPINSDTPLIRRMIKKILKVLIPFNLAEKLIDYLINISNDKETKFIANYYGRWGNKEIIKKIF